MTTPAQNPQDALTHAVESMNQANAAISAEAQRVADEREAAPEPTDPE